MTRGFFHSGDLGDIIASLPVIRELGGGSLSIGPHDRYGHHNPRETMTLQRYRFIEPLLSAQSYITSVNYQTRQPNDTDMCGFRATKRLPHESLVHWQARYLGVEKVSLAPWLVAGKSFCRSPIYMAISRSLRYHNPRFPWKAVMLCGPDPLFLGFPNEHRAFQEYIGQKIAYAPVTDALHMAIILNSACAHFCNQSLPFWISAGLGKTVYQETFAGEDNAIIRSANLHYTRTDKELEWLENFLGIGGLTSSHAARI